MAGSLQLAILRQWHGAQMEEESQDQWSGTADVLAAHFTGTPFGVYQDLVFETNVYEQWREPSQDNEVRASIRVYSSAAACTAPPPPPPLPPITQISPTVYELSRPFVLSLANQPERILRGAPLAPERVGSSGLGFHFFMLEPDSIPAALGAKKGDILWRVGGNPIGPNTASTALQTLLTTGEVRVTILRNQVQRQFTYRLR